MRAVPLLACYASASASVPAGPGAGPWTVSTPEAHGLSTAAIEVANAYVSEIATTRLCMSIIKDGELIYDSGTPEVSHAAFSVTKTLGALVAGVAVSDGDLVLDEDITEAHGVESPKPYAVTSAEILSQALAADDAAGKEFAYDAEGSLWIDTMAKVVKASTGQSAGDVWTDRLARPLGLSNSSTFTWDNAEIWGYGSEASCHDLARVGQLLLNEGEWKVGDGTKQLVSRDYIQQLRKPHKYNGYDHTNPCYGYLTWLASNPSDFDSPCKGDTGGDSPVYFPFPEGTPHDLFYAAGYHGQLIMVFPSYNAVVVSMGDYYVSYGTGSEVAPIVMTGLLIGDVFSNGTVVV